MADQQPYVFEAPPPDPGLVQRITEVYLGDATIKSEIGVTDLGIKIRDFDGKEMKLWKCLYKVGTVQSPRLIKRGNPSDVKLVSSYPFLRNFHHSAAVQVENYFKSECLVISIVNGTFSKWLASKVKTDLFTEEGTMLPVIRNMIIELASLVESLIINEVYPINLTLKDMYIKLLSDGTPRLQVHITEVGDTSVNAHVQDAWKRVKKIIEQSFASHNFDPNEATKSFCGFIGMPEKNIGLLLQDFPDQWDDFRKGVFLTESCANSNQVRYNINNKSGLKWPRTSDGSAYPKLLLELLAHGRKRSKYDVNYPYDYFRLCRNLYKHFNELSRSLKTKLGGDRNGLLRQIDAWNPNMWSMLYTALHA